MQLDSAAQHRQMTLTLSDPTWIPHKSNIWYNSPVPYGQSMQPTCLLCHGNKPVSFKKVAQKYEWKKESL